MSRIERKYCLISTSLSPPQRLWKFFKIILGIGFRPTAKKPLRSKQHDRGLCGGEREYFILTGLFDIFILLHI